MPPLHHHDDPETEPFFSSTDPHPHSLRQTGEGETPRERTEKRKVEERKGNTAVWDEEKEGGRKRTMEERKNKRKKG